MKLNPLNLLKPSYHCLICDCKCVENYTTIKYRYENDKEGEVYLCEGCSKEYEIDESMMNEQSI